MTESNKVTPIDIQYLTRKFQQQENNNTKHKIQNLKVSNEPKHQQEQIIDKISNQNSPNNLNISSVSSTYSSEEISSSSSSSSTSSKSFQDFIHTQEYNNKMVKHKLAAELDTFNESNTNDIITMNQQPLKMITFNPPSVSSSPSLSSNNKRPAPLAPTVINNIIKHHEPVVKIKDNQLKLTTASKKQAPILQTQNETKILSEETVVTTTTATTKLSTSLSSSTKSNKSVFSSILSTTEESTSTTCSNLTNENNNINNKNDCENNNNICRLPLSSSSSSSTSSTSSVKSNKIDTHRLLDDNHLSNSSSDEQKEDLSPNPIVNSNNQHANTTDSGFCFNNLAYDDFNSTSYLVDNTSNMTNNELMMSDLSNVREMAIDCPDNFMPEVKTKPCYPPVLNTLNNTTVLTTTTTTTTTAPTTTNTNSHQKNILKPLLNIIGSKDKNTDNNSSTSTTTKTKKKNKNNKNKKTDIVIVEQKQAVVEQLPEPSVASIMPTSNVQDKQEEIPQPEPQIQPQQQEPPPIPDTLPPTPISEANANIIIASSSLIHPNPNANLAPQQPLSASSSSIQFIDEDTRSRIMLNNTTSTNLLICDSPAKDLDQQNKVVSVGKKLFEKQKQIVNGEIVETEPTTEQENTTLKEESCSIQMTESEMRKHKEREDFFLANSLRTSEKLKKLSAGTVMKKVPTAAAATTTTQATTFTNDFMKCGTVNDGFEMDDFDMAKSIRQPTPPLRHDQQMTCFDDLIQSINQLDIDFKNLATNNCNNNDSNIKLIEQFKEITTTKDNIIINEDNKICIQLNDTNNYFKAIQEKSFELALSSPPIMSSSTTSPVISSSSNAISPSTGSSGSTGSTTNDFQSNNINNKPDINHISKTIEIQDLFKHIDLIQNKIESIKHHTNRASSTPTMLVRNIENEFNKTDEIAFSNSGDFDIEKFFHSCNQDINLLVRLCETDNFKNTLNLYNKLIKLNASLSLKPLASNSHQLSQEVNTKSFLFPFLFLLLISICLFKNLNIIIIYD